MLRDDEVIESMERYGGHFIQALANAARKADLDNLRKIKEAFLQEWQKYSDLAEGRRG